ncbi:MAG: hypothetical protein J3K34DRAFT_92563 [Monoraphidium minutum]|nr:MAG: hypothetical protein J3K34DRAFT_92563 [Monoraphidium minutum]
MDWVLHVTGPFCPEQRPQNNTHILVCFTFAAYVLIACIPAATHLPVNRTPTKPAQASRITAKQLLVGRGHGRWHAMTHRTGAPRPSARHLGGRGRSALGPCAWMGSPGSRGWGGGRCTFTLAAMGGTPTRELGRPQFWDAPRMGGGGAQHDPTWMLFVGGVAAPGADFDIQCFIVKVLTRCVAGHSQSGHPRLGSLGGPRIDKGIDGRPVGVAGRGRSAAGGRLKAQPGRRVPLIGTCLCACARMCVWGE